MNQEIIHHKLSYLILACGLSLLTFFFYIAWPSRVIQRGIIAFMVIFYTVWGVFSHLNHHHVDKKVFLEYFAVALLSGSILFLITI